MVSNMCALLYVAQVYFDKFSLQNKNAHIILCSSFISPNITNCAPLLYIYASQADTAAFFAKKKTKKKKFKAFNANKIDASAVTNLEVSLLHMFCVIVCGCCMGVDCNIYMYLSYATYTLY